MLVLVRGGRGVDEDDVDDMTPAWELYNKHPILRRRLRIHGHERSIEGK